MEIRGKVIDLLDEKRGEGRNGEWRKRDFVLETTTDQYPKKVCIAMWGDKIDQFSLKVGEDVNVHFNLESREFNGKWYTDVKAWKIDKNAGEQMGGASEASAPMEVPQGDFNDGGDDGGDLPF